VLREKKSKKEKEVAEPAAAEEPAAAPAAPSPVAASPAADGICKCFLGNLSYSIEDDAVREFFKDVGPITDIHWLTDKESGQFYGSGFIEFGTPAEAQAALAKAGEDLLGRPLKIDLAKPRAPRADGGAGGGAGGGFKKKPFEVKPLGPKPDGCNTVFMGNLSYQIDEDAVKTFFADCGEIANIRWLTDRETGDFKGCGFCEFASSDSVDNVVAKNGQDLMGRPLRLDYSTPKPKKEW
jgi:nucleolin